MRHFIKSITRVDLFVLLLCFLSYLLLACQSLPLSADDFYYRFNQATGDQINSFSDLIQSNVFGYENVNGRFLVHVFVQSIMAWDLHGFFYIASACALLLLFSSILYLVRREKKTEKDLVYVLFFLIIFYPLMASTCYGTVALTVNYLWSAAIYTFFIAVYCHVKDDCVNYSIGQNILLFIFGLLCGSWQESFGIGIGGAICLYHLLNLRSTKKSVYYLIIGFGIGLSILVFAPGNFVRIGIENEGYRGVGHLTYQIVQLCKHNLFVGLWVVIGILSMVIDFVKKDKFAFVRNNWLYFLVCAITILFTVYTLAFGMMQGTWQLTVLAIMDVILMYKFLQIYIPQFLQSNLVCTIVIIFMCALMGVVYGYRDVIKTEKRLFIEDFYTQKSDTAYDGKLQYAVMHSIPSHNEFIYEKVCDMYCSFYDEHTLSCMSRYHTCGEEVWGTLLLPEPPKTIIAHCTKDNQINDNVYLTPLEYYVVKISKQDVNPNCLLVLKLEKKAAFYRILDKMRNKQYIESIPIGSLKTIEDSDYIYAVKTLDWWHYHKMKVVRAAFQ